MSKLDKRPDYTARLPRTSHDISQRLHFTSAPGMMLPVYHHPLNPSDKIYLTAEMFTRSNNIVAPALAEIETKIDFFFVPMTMLCTYFENWFYGTQDFVSSSLNPNTIGGSTRNELANLPLCNLDDSIRGGEADTLSWFEQNPKEAMDRYRLFMHLGYNPNALFSEVAALTPGTGKRPCYYDTVSPNVFPYALLAYNAIYYRHYRLEDWEPNRVDTYNVDKYLSNSQFSLFSCSLHFIPRYKDYFTSVKNNPIASFTSALNFDSQNQQPADFYLNQVENYLLASNKDFRSIDNSKALSSFTGMPVNGAGNNILGVGFASQNSTYPVAAGIASSPNYLRTNFAIEKLLRVYGRAQKNYDSQILAHFGWKVPHDVKHNLTFLGSFSGSLDIKEVTSMADTDTAALGSFAAKGYANISGKQIEFQAPVHGVLMGICYTRPKVSYEMCGFDKVNVLNKRTDFFQPEFDSLGMQPLFNYEINFTGNRASGYAGWQYRYEQFKRKYPKYSIAFADPDQPSISTIHVSNQFSSWLVGQRPFTDLPNSALQAANQISETAIYNRLYVRATDLNHIMSIPFSYVWSHDFFLKPWLMFQKDPFIHWLGINCKLVSIMSQYGEPELDV